VLAAGRRFDAMIGWVGDLGPYTRRLTAKNLWQTLPITIVVDDGNGYRSIYAHFAKIVVRAGQTIKAGQFLGYEGQTGHASGCHLHFGIFSPAETMLMSVRPEVIARMKLPRYALMRIDPLRVLPHRRGRGDPRPRTYLATRETAAAARRGIDPHPIPAPTSAPAPAVSPPSSEEPSGPPTRPRS
jgi:murein DD-endopeptidase MepM/ murein hydrolase activator NlpD